MAAKSFVLTVAAVLMLAFSAGADAATMEAGRKLKAGQSVSSGNGRVRLEMQSDGYLLLTWKTEAGTRVPIWHAGSGAKGSYAVMQNDGNFVVYAPDSKPVWASGTDNQPGSIVWVQNDGNLVVRKDRKALWASDTNKPAERPVWIRASKDRMAMAIKISRTGIVEAHRDAAIKKLSDNWHHVYWFALLDENDNTLWVAPVETLTLGAKVGTSISDLGKPIDYSKHEIANYNVIKDIAGKVWSAAVFMKQEKSGGTLIERIEEAAEAFGRLDDAYKTVKDSELVKDGSKDYSGAEKKE